MMTKVSTEVSKLEALDVYLDLDNDTWTTSSLARAWRKGEESETFENVRRFIAVVVWVFLWIVLSKILIKIGE